MADSPEEKEGADTVREFEAQVGSVESLDGQTRVRVVRSGDFVIAHEQAAEARTDAGDGEPTQGRGKGKEEGEGQGEEARGNVRQLLDLDPDVLFEQLPLAVDDRFPSRPGLPDEPILTIVLDTEAGTRVTRMWLRDAEERAPRLVDPLRAIVERATDGRRYL